MQILNLKQYQYNKTYCNKVTNPAFKQESKDTIPPEKTLIAAFQSPDDPNISEQCKNFINLDLATVDPNTGKTILYTLCEKGYASYVNLLLMLPKNQNSPAINIPCNGQTPYDVATVQKMKNKMAALGAKPYSDLTDEEKARDTFISSQKGKFDAQQPQNARVQTQEQKSVSPDNDSQESPAKNQATQFPKDDAKLGSTETFQKPEYQLNSKFMKDRKTELIKLQKLINKTKNEELKAYF